VTINEEKMSKSLGNFFTIREILDKSPWEQAVTAEALRYLLLGTHYRSPIDFSDEGLRGAKAGLDGFYDLLGRLAEREGKSDRGEGNEIARPVLDTIEGDFNAAMDDDLNTAQALGVLHHARTELNRALGRGMGLALAERAGQTLRKLGGVLGLEFRAVRRSERGQIHTGSGSLIAGPATLTGSGSVGTMSDADVARLVDARNAARARRDWAAADSIRKQLAAAGITIEDRPDGTTRVKR
jgi:cysteinyl-tRNA synthetase